MFDILVTVVFYVCFYISLAVGLLLVVATLDDLCGIGLFKHLP